MRERESLPVEDFPVLVGGLAVSAEPVVGLDAELGDEPAAEEDGGGVREGDVGDEVVPPALAEVGHDVLPGQLEELGEDAPHVDEGRVAQHEGGQEEVHPVDHVVVVHVVPQRLQRQVAVVVVRVHVLRHRLVQLRVQEPEQGSPR
jgi:hypothetical protein